MKKIMILGSGELGKEFVISAQRLGQYTIAVDKYKSAPAMQVAHEHEVVDMLDPEQLERIVAKHKPDIIVPEIEAIRTEKLEEFEKRGIFVVPTARATYLTMNRDAIRDIAAKDLGLKTAKYLFAESEVELLNACKELKFPCVIKPLMSSSGKGQTVARNENDIEESWKIACSDARGDSQKVIAEEFINFTTEITLLTIKQKSGPTFFIKPIGHRQEGGDYRESWLPAQISPELLNKAQVMAKIITDNLGGAGLYGVEFFITEDDVYFSELSPRPHDTGMVTLVGQSLSEFDLHLRAILGLPIQKISYFSEAAASYAILADQESSDAPQISGVEEALQLEDVDLRIFNKPSTRKNRRMAVTLATGVSTQNARDKAKKSAEKIKLRYN